MEYMLFLLNIIILQQKFRVQDLINYRLHHIHTLMDSMWNWNPKKLEIDRRLEDLRTYLKKVVLIILFLMQPEIKNVPRFDEFVRF